MGNALGQPASIPNRTEIRCASNSQPITEAAWGWDRPRFLDEVRARWARMEDSLPLESATTDEEVQVAHMRLALLEQQGLKVPPSDWRAHLYTRRTLLTYLRARDGDVKKAMHRALLCIAWVGRSFAAAAAYEAEPRERRALAKEHMPAGLFGTDRRGVSVHYIRAGLMDFQGLLKKTSIEFWAASEAYSAIFLTDTLFRESLLAGRRLNGRIQVIDITFARDNSCQTH